MRGEQSPTWTTPENNEGFRCSRSPHSAAADYFHSLLDRAKVGNEASYRCRLKSCSMAPASLFLMCAIETLFAVFLTREEVALMVSPANRWRMLKISKSRTTAKEPEPNSNGMTGLGGGRLKTGGSAQHRPIRQAKAPTDMPEGRAFWYRVSPLRGRCPAVIHWRVP